MDTESIKQTIKFHASLEVMSFDEAAVLSNNLLNRLHQQRKDGKFCDAVITIDKVDFRAHKCVLAASSPYFETALAEVSDTKKQKIRVFSNSAEILIQVLDYLYTGQIKINTENFAEIIDLAVRFSLSKLQDHCTKYLIENINDKTCFHIHDLAKQHGLSSLMNTVDGFVYANILKLIESDNILEVGLSSLETLLGRSVPMLERQRLRVINRWVEHKTNIRKDSLPVLLKLVNWLALPADDLNNFIQSSELILEDDWMYFHVLLSLNNADALPEKCKERFASLKEVYMKSNNDNSIKVVKHSPVDKQKEEFLIHISDVESDGGTVFYPLENEAQETAPPPTKRESSRLAMKLKKIKDSQLQATPSTTNKKSKKRSSRKEANKENLTDNLNGASALLSNCKKKEKRKLNKPLSVRARKPRDGAKKTEIVNCLECPFKANSSLKLQRHINVAHKDLSKIFSCDICDFTCKWNRQFYSHLRDVHFPGPPFHCDKCGHSAVSIQQLLLHRMDHSESRPHSCNICGARFKVKYVLEAHLRSHTGEKPYKCNTCQRSFTTKGTLDQHKSTHNSQRPYLCHLCGFSTKYQNHLKSHSRIHTGEVFKCQFADCDYETPKRSRLACHQRSHLHIQCHTCSTCGRSFVERSHLVRHERIHLDERPFRCELCDYASTRRDKLKEHKKKYHDAASLESNKMAYRPRKSRLQSSINKNNKNSPASAGSKSAQTGNKQASKRPLKRKIEIQVLDSIPEDHLPASSVPFVKRASNVSQSGKNKCNDNLLMREAEMRSWLERTSKIPPVSPIKIDTGVAQETNLSDISPNFYSFTSHFSSSSGISKGQYGSSSSGIGSQGTGEANIISPTTSNRLASDVSSPGAGSSSSQHLSPSTSGKTSERAGDRSKIQRATGIHRILTVCTQQVSPELQAAKKKLIHERLRRFVSSKSAPQTQTRKIIISIPQQSFQPVPVVTFKPDGPPRPSNNDPSTSQLRSP